MNMKRGLLLLCTTMLSLASHAQYNIERLLPAFAQLDDVDVKETIDNGTMFHFKEPYHSVAIFGAAIDKIPSWLVDSLIVAFDRELPLATESDRYQKHSEKGDTLSYTLAYNGRINPVDDKARINVMNHSYSHNITASAVLDIDNKTLRFYYNKVGKEHHRIWQFPTESEESISDIFNELAKDKELKIIPVSYDIDNGDYSGDWLFSNNPYGYVHRQGICIEVPVAKGADVFQRLFLAIANIDYDKEPLYCSFSQNEASVVFGKKWSGDAYCLHRLEDGRVFVLHIEKPKEPSDMAIPLNWHEVYQISRLKK